MPPPEPSAICATPRISSTRRPPSSAGTTSPIRARSSRAPTCGRCRRRMTRSRRRARCSSGCEAYYVQMSLPGNADPEFVLLQPMVPQGKQNMIAWVAVRNDPTSYGKVTRRRFPARLERLRAAADPGLAQPEREDQRTADALGPGWQHGDPRQSAGPSNTGLAPVRGARLHSRVQQRPPDVPEGDRWNSHSGCLGRHPRRSAEPDLRGRRGRSPAAAPRREPRPLRRHR